MPAARRGDRRSRARSSSASSSSQQPWTSPMMSNGPCSSRRSFHSGSRSIVGRVDLLRRAAGRGRGGSPRAAGRAASGAAARVWLRTTCGPKSRSGAAALRSWQTALGQVEHDRDRQHVVLAGQRDQRLAGLGLHVGGVDDGQPPARQPLAGDEVQHLERVVGRGLVVLVVGDQAAAEVGREHLGRRKCLRANVDLPEPEAPTGRRGDSSGIVESSVIGVEHRHLRRRPDARVLGADRQEPHRVAVAGRRRPSAQACELARASTRSGGRGGGTCPAGSVSKRDVVLGVRRGHDDRRRAARARTRRARTPPGAAGRGARSPRPARRRRSPPSRASR